MKYYTIYNNNTDNIVAFGSTKNCAKMLNTSTDVVRSIVCRVNKGENKKILNSSRRCKRVQKRTINFGNFASIHRHKKGVIYYL